MKYLVALVEGHSEKELLDNLLPRVFPGIQIHGNETEVSGLENSPYFGLYFFCFTFDGKSDLLVECEKKLQNWQVPDSAFFILCDMDEENCEALKERIVKIGEKTGKSNTLVRIACKELESWYLGDSQAIELVFSLTGKKINAFMKRLGEPDSITKPSQHLKSLTKGAYHKRMSSRAMGKILSTNPEDNLSESFGVFIRGLHKFVTEFMDKRLEEQ